MAFTGSLLYIVWLRFHWYPPYIQETMQKPCHCMGKIGNVLNSIALMFTVCVAKALLQTNKVVSQLYTKPFRPGKHD